MQKLHILHSEVIGCQASIVDLEHKSGIIHSSIKDLRTIRKYELANFGSSVDWKIGQYKTEFGKNSQVKSKNITVKA